VIWRIVDSYKEPGGPTQFCLKMHDKITRTWHPVRSAKKTAAQKTPQAVVHTDVFEMMTYSFPLA
jgi:hypothetical protein